MEAAAVSIYYPEKENPRTAQEVSDELIKFIKHYDGSNISVPSVYENDLAQMIESMISRNSDVCINDRSADDYTLPEEYRCGLSFEEKEESFEKPPMPLPDLIRDENSMIFFTMMIYSGIICSFVSGVISVIGHLLLGSGITLTVLSFLLDERKDKDQMEKEPDRIDTGKAGSKGLPGTVIKDKELHGYISRFERLREEIFDKDMTNALDILIDRLTQITEETERHHEKAGQMSRMKRYYLPTLENLLTKYTEFAGCEENESIEKQKKDIQRSLDMINKALAQIYDDLFYDDEIDTSSDVSVMQEMLVQDGYLQDDMTIKKSGGNSREQVPEMKARK